MSQTRPVSALLYGDRKVLYFHEDERLEFYYLGLDPREQHDAAGKASPDDQRHRRLLMERLREAGARMPVRDLIE